MAAQVWAIGAGKGGVGKTFVSSSFGITLSKMNSKVLLIDFDFSGANLHTLFGSELSDRNLRTYVEGKAALAEIISSTSVPKLSYVQGFWDTWGAPSLTLEKTKALISEARELPYDYVIFDMGPGPHVANLELFGAADERFLICNTEPTTIEKTYRFIEAFICRELQKVTNKEQHQKLITALQSFHIKEKSNVLFSFRNYLQEATNIDVDFFAELEKHPVRLILNGTRSRAEQDLGYSIKSVCNKHFDFGIDYIGAVEHDNAVWQSVKSRKPVLLDKPFTPLAGQFLSICKSITCPNFQSNLYKAVV